MQYWWRCEINSSTGELILVTQLAALQIAELLLILSTQFGELTIVILVTDLSVRRTDGSTELAECAMRKFEKVYFAEFHLQNVPQITP